MILRWRLRLRSSTIDSLFDITTGRNSAAVQPPSTPLGTLRETGD